MHSDGRCYKLNCIWLFLLVMLLDSKDREREREKERAIAKGLLLYSCRGRSFGRISFQVLCTGGMVVVVVVVVV